MDSSILRQHLYSNVIYLGGSSIGIGLTIELNVLKRIYRTQFFTYA